MSYISSNAKVSESRFTGHVWRSADGAVNATVDLAPGNSWIAFDNPAHAHSLAAACTEAAKAMERFESGEETGDG